MARRRNSSPFARRRSRPTCAPRARAPRCRSASSAGAARPAPGPAPASSPRGPARRGPRAAPPAGRRATAPSRTPRARRPCRPSPARASRPGSGPPPTWGAASRRRLRDRGRAIEVAARQQAARQHELRREVARLRRGRLLGELAADGRALRCSSILASCTCATAARGFRRSTSANDFAAASRSRFASWTVPSRKCASAFCGSSLHGLLRVLQRLVEPAVGQQQPAADDARRRQRRVLRDDLVHGAEGVGGLALRRTGWRRSSSLASAQYSRVGAQLLEDGDGVGRPLHPRVVVGKRELRVGGARGARPTS